MIAYYEPTSILRFVDRDGPAILQQWWGLYRIDRESNRHPTNDGYWADIRMGPEMNTPPAIEDAYRPAPNDA